jgi:hypothetical protein
VKSLKRAAGPSKWIMKKSLVLGAVQIQAMLDKVRITVKGFGNNKKECDIVTKEVRNSFWS